MREPEVLYDAGRRRIRVRAVQIFALAVAVVAVWSGAHLARTYGQREADGGMLAPLPVRLAWGLGVSALGLAFAGGMGLYGRQYVARISLGTDSDTLEIETLGCFGVQRTTIPAADLVVGDYYGGRQSLRAARSVDAPWLTVRVPGRRLPLVVDARGVVLDSARLFDLLALDLSTGAAAEEDDDTLDDEALDGAGATREADRIADRPPTTTPDRCATPDGSTRPPG